MSGPTPAQAARFAQALAGLGATGRIGLAVSGGPDSLALLLLAHAARPGAITAATVDHGLRPEAPAEARLVHAACRDRGIAHATLGVTLRSSGQAEARAARYAALERWTIDQGLTALATAHHVDDQAETVLMRLARGAGVTGLAGVRPVRRLESGLLLVRPLLAWRRAELAAIVAAARLVPVDDPSNRDPRYDRTRARALLAGAWPDAGRVAAAARNLADADEALDWAARREAAGRVVEDDGTLLIDPADLPDELLRRLVARALRAIAGDDEAIGGPELTRMIERLRAGEHATLGPVKAAPGARWRFEPAAPHR